MIYNEKELGDLIITGVKKDFYRITAEGLPRGVSDKVNLHILASDEDEARAIATGYFNTIKHSFDDITEIGVENINLIKHISDELVQKKRKWEKTFIYKWVVWTAWLISVLCLTLAKTLAIILMPFALAYDWMKLCYKKIWNKQ